MSEESITTNITWSELVGDECRLQLQIAGERILLAWQVRWHSVWIEGMSGDQTLTPEQLGAATLHARGSAGDRFELILQNGSHRAISLGARGRYDNILDKDPLADLLREHTWTTTVVNVRSNADEWSLLKFVQRPRVKSLTINYLPDLGKLSLRIDADKRWIGQFRYQLRPDTDDYFSSVVIQETQELLPSSEILISLEMGTYILEILCDDEPLDLAPQSQRFRVEHAAGMSASSIHDGTVVRIADVLEKGNLLQALLRVDGVGAENHWLSLATMPGTLLISEPFGSLDKVWFPLGWLARVSRRQDWRDNYGLLPAWAVTAHPFRFTTRAHRWTLELEPELAFDRGNSGVGFVDLKLDGASATRAYAHWEPANDRNWLRLQVMVPETEPTVPYSELDELDLWPIYMCTSCGKLVGSRGGFNKFSPTVVLQHRHNREKPELRDIVYDVPLHGQTIIARLTSVVELYSPEQIVDPDFTRELLHSHAKPELDMPRTLTTKEGYQYATGEWVHVLAHDGAERQMLYKLVKHAPWRQAFDRVNAFVMEQDYSHQGSPMIAAMSRLLMAFPKFSDSGNDFMRLDRHLLFLALLLRGVVNLESEPRKRLKETAGLTDAEMDELVHAAGRACPALFAWALTWIELFSLHAAC